VLTGNSTATSFTVDANAESAALGVTTSAIVNNTVNPTSSTRDTLQTNYNALLTQIDQLAGDAFYNGVNLLAGNNLTVNFNEIGTSSLTIAGVNFNSTGLGLSHIAAGAFQSNGNITTAETAVNKAITAVPAQTETFGTNSSTIQTRQTFEQNMINTLQTGASNLVLADPEPRECRPLDRANPAAVGNLGTVDRQSGEPVGAQVVPLVPSGAGLRSTLLAQACKGGGAKAPPPSLLDEFLLRS